MNGHKKNPRFREGPRVAYGIRAQKERGLFDHHLLTIDDVQTLGGSDDALAGDVVDGLAGGLTSGDVVNAGVEWSLDPADGRLTNLVATVVDALNTYLCPTFEDGSVVVEVDAVGVVP